MRETPGSDGRSEVDPEETAKLELPPLRLPRLSRRPRGAAHESQPEAPTAPPPGTELWKTGLQDLQDLQPEDEEPEDEERPVRRRPTLPPLAVPVVAALTGALVGLVGVVATYLALQGCETVRGTESC